MNYYKHEIKRECNTFLNAVIMRVSEVVLYKIYTAIYHENSNISVGYKWL